MELIRLTTIFVMLSLVCSLEVRANLSSPFSSTVSGLTIPNSHIVSSHSGAQVIRGQAPQLAEIDQLLSIGVERIIIFKNQTQGEVTKELSDLKKKGFRANDILQVDMPWKDIGNFQDVCEMTLQSLQFIEESAQTKRTVYFHCTVGEDRTGYLAGLWGLWNGNYRTTNQAFEQEMCNHGYEAGDHKKPYVVVKAVRENLTPTFLKMVDLLAEARRSGKNLRQIKCPREIQQSKAIPTC